MSRSQLDAMLAESLLAPEETDQLVAVLAPLADLSGQVPAPSAELNLLFGAEPRSGTWRSERGAAAPRSGRRGSGTVAGVVVLALSGVGATGLSAAANTLPGAWQHQVSEFSSRYLPFDFPDPRVGPPNPSRKAHDAGETPRRHGDVQDAPLDNTPEGSGSVTREGAEAHGAPSWHAPAPRGETRPSRTGYVHPLPQGPRPTDATSRPSGGHQSAEDDVSEVRTHGNQEPRGHSERPGSPGNPGSPGSMDDDRDKKAGLADRPVKGKSKGAPKDPRTGKPAGGDDPADSGQDRSEDVDPDRGHEENRPGRPEDGQQHPDDSAPDPANDSDTSGDHSGDHAGDQSGDHAGDRVGDDAWPDLQLREGDLPRT